MQITQWIFDILGSIWNYLVTASGYVALGIRIAVILIIVVIVERTCYKIYAKIRTPPRTWP